MAKNEETTKKDAATTDPAAGTQSAEAVPQPAEPEVEVFEIIHGMVAIGAEIRTVGAEIRSGEVDVATLEALVRDGIARNTRAPLSPAEVSEHVVDHLLGLAQEIGLVKNDGAKYTFDGKSYVGRMALRQAVTTDRVKAAIRDAFKTKNAAIEELSGRVANAPAS